MRRRVLCLLFILLAAISFCGCGIENEYENYHEVYSVDYEYYFYVPSKYEKFISTFGYSSSVIVRYSSNAHVMVSIGEYYSSLNAEQRDANTRENYTMGDPALNDTFNNKEYIKTFFEDYFDSISSLSDVSNLKQVVINSRSYWCCRAYTFYSDYNAAKDGVTDKFKGETVLYYTIYNGMTYLINISSSGGFLISDTAMVGDFMNNFHVGVRLSPNIHYIWAAVILLVILDIVFIFSVFFKFSWEPLYLPEEEPYYISPLSLISPLASYGSSHIAAIREGLLMDRILQRTDESISVEETDSLLSKMQARAKMDEILDRKGEEDEVSPLTENQIDMLYFPQTDPLSIGAAKRAEKFEKALSVKDATVFNESKPDKKPISFRIRETIAKIGSKWENNRMKLAQKAKDSLLQSKKAIKEGARNISDGFIKLSDKQDAKAQERLEEELIKKTLADQAELKAKTEKDDANEAEYVSKTDITPQSSPQAAEKEAGQNLQTADISEAEQMRNTEAEDMPQAEEAELTPAETPETAELEPEHIAIPEASDIVTTKEAIPAENTNEEAENKPETEEAEHTPAEFPATAELEPEQITIPEASEIVAATLQAQNKTSDPQESKDYIPTHGGNMDRILERRVGRAPDEGNVNFDNEDEGKREP